MLFLKGKSHDLGDQFFITRYLPDIQRRSVGPFIFFDFFGPVDFPPGKGVDVRPHPHIGLATVTYLFEGAQMHRDTLGSEGTIRAGDVQVMSAGTGIRHAEFNKGKVPLKMISLPLGAMLAALIRGS